MVLLGPTEAGKTSMVESLIAGKAILVSIEDPESWVEFYKQIIATKKIYLTLNEIKQLCTTTILLRFKYLSTSKAILHPSFLKDYVFPDIDLIVNRFKSLFCHNLTQKINYNNNEKLQAIFQKGELDLAIHRYEKEGLLSSKLLSFLWEQYGLSFHDQDALVHLMHSFNLCYGISKDETLHFSLVCGFTRPP